jgi:hypothetical protein
LLLPLSSLNLKNTPKHGGLSIGKTTQFISKLLYKPTMGVGYAYMSES